MKKAHIIDKLVESDDILVVEANSIPDEGSLEGIISDMKIRIGGNLNNKAIYLPNPDDYSYEVVLDNCKRPCLLVTRK